MSVTGSASEAVPNCELYSYRAAAVLFRRSSGVGTPWPEDMLVSNATVEMPIRCEWSVYIGNSSYDPRTNNATWKEKQLTGRDLLSWPLSSAEATINTLIIPAMLPTLADMAVWREGGWVSAVSPLYGGMELLVEENSTVLLTSSSPEESQSMTGYGAPWPLPFQYSTDHKGPIEVWYEVEVYTGGVECEVVEHNELELVVIVPSKEKICQTSPMACTEGSYLDLAVVVSTVVSFRAGKDVWATRSVACPPDCPALGLGVYFSQQCSGYLTGDSCLQPSTAHRCAFGSGSECRPCPEGAVCPGKPTHTRLLVLFRLD